MPNEAIHRLLMQLYADSGDLASASRQYGECMRKARTGIRGCDRQKKPRRFINQIKEASTGWRVPAWLNTRQRLAGIHRISHNDRLPLTRNCQLRKFHPPI